MAQTTPNIPDNQMEALKSYAGYIITAILVALAGYFGWTYWQNNHAKVDTVAADQYADIQRLNDEVSLMAQNPDLEAEAKSALTQKQNQLNQDIDNLVATHNSTVYAWQALMIKARKQADDNDFAAASKTLKQALAIDLQDAGLKAITQLRYAQVQLANGDSDGALATLKQDLPNTFEASKQELLGDISLAKGDKEAAIKAYTNAWELLREREENRSVLAVKMDSLGVTVEPIEPSQRLIAMPSATPAADLQSQQTADFVNQDNSNDTEQEE